MRTSLPLGFGELTPLTLGVGELRAHTINPLLLVWDRIGDSRDDCTSDETYHEWKK